MLWLLTFAATGPAGAQPLSLNHVPPQIAEVLHADDRFVSVPLRGLPHQDPHPAQPEEASARQRKIVTLIRDTIARLEAEGVDRLNAVRLDAAKRFSSSLVRVDNQARIQLYIQLTDVSENRLSVLRRTGRLEIEVSNADLKVVQAWVPYEQIRAVAGLDFVTRISPPAYTTR